MAQNWYWNQMAAELSQYFRVRWSEVQASPIDIEDWRHASERYLSNPICAQERLAMSLLEIAECGRDGLDMPRRVCGVFCLSSRACLGPQSYSTVSTWVCRWTELLWLSSGADQRQSAALLRQVEHWALQLYRRPHLPKGIPEKTLILLHTLFEKLQKSGEDPCPQF